MISPSVFQRYEIKYLLDARQKEAVMDAMLDRMEPDCFGRSTIRNLYYDTDSYRLVRRSLEQPVYKEKLRVRSYGAARPEDPVFVELKKKYRSVVYKRRVDLSEREVPDYLAGKIPAPKPSQITREIDYFVRFYETLEPKVFLSYEREAFFGKEDSGFRITFDENILFRTHELSLEEECYGENILEDGQTLMEVKTAGAVPLWLADTLAKQGIGKVSFSKYGTAYRRLFWNHRAGVPGSEPESGYERKKREDNIHVEGTVQRNF